MAKAARPARISRVIGKEKSKEYLLESIIKPSAHIAAGFDIVTFTLKNGETETGSLASESPTQIVLKRADNTTVTIDPKQVKTARHRAVVDARDLWRRS